MLGDVASCESLVAMNCTQHSKHELLEILRPGWTLIRQDEEALMSKYRCVSGLVAKGYMLFQEDTASAEPQFHLVAATQERWADHR